MDLVKLFEAQKELDERIVKEKGLEGVDLLPEKILALLTELGELSNEWRGFKFWSEDREPRTKERNECFHCAGHGDFEVEPEYANHSASYVDCEKCEGSGFNGTRSPLLEEYVDCLHFTLSIGLEFGDIIFDIRDMEIYFEDVEAVDITGQFITTSWLVGCLFESKALHYEQALFNVLKLGELLGFTTDQIETSYYEKNKINHSRQENNY